MSPAKKKATTGTTAAKKSPVKKTAAKKAPAKKAPAEKVAATKEPSGKPAEETSVPPGTDPVEDVAFDDDLFDDDLWGADWSDLGSGPGPDAPGTGDQDAPHHLASDGVELFQQAARELIAAARNALDAAEDLVDDPRVIGTTLESLRDIATETLRAARPVVRPRPGRTARTDDAVDYQAIPVDDD